MIMPQLRRRVLTLSSLASAVLAASAAGQVLQIHNGSLTTNLMAAATPVQGVLPLVEQRSVNIDGTEREPSPFGWAIATNPFPEPWNDNLKSGEMRIDIGTYAPSEIDLAMPSAGMRWVVGRSYNARQQIAASAGPQGNNWFQNSQPELVLWDADSNNSTRGNTDILYLVTRADAFLEFKRKGSEGDDAFLFVGVNGTAGGVRVIVDEEGADLYVYYDQTGLEVWFFAPDDHDIAAAKRGQLWRMVRRGTNDMSESDDLFAYVGDKTDKADALTNGYDGSGRIVAAWDTSERKYEYTYASGKLTQVEVQAWSGSAWVATGDRVEYAYYGVSEPFGNDGDLKLVTVTHPNSDGDRDIVESTYYRYYTSGTYHAETNPGHPHGIQMVVKPEGCRRFDWTGDQSFDADYLTATNDALGLYSSVILEYYDDSTYDRQVRAAMFNGECGCGGGGALDGKYEYTYESNPAFSGTSGYDTAWRTRTMVTEPLADVTPPSNGAGKFDIRYFDETSQPLSRVACKSTPPTPAPSESPRYLAAPMWPYLVTRDSIGCIVKIHWPANFGDVTDYAHWTTGGLPDGTFTPENSVGLVRQYLRVSSGAATGFLEAVKYQRGADTGTPPPAYYEHKNEYTSATLTPTTGLTIVRPLLAAEREYPAQGTSDTAYNRTEYAYSMHSGGASLMPKRIETIHPAVSTGNNGSGVAATSDRYLRVDGTLAFTRAADGIFNYSQYSGGLLAKAIEDCQTNHATDFASGDDPNTNFGITETASGTRIVTTHSYDGNGRSDVTTLYVGSADELKKKYYLTVLDDGRPAAFGIPKMTTGGSTTYFGPVTYRVANLAGNVEFDGILALDGNSTTTALDGWTQSNPGTPFDDPLKALDGGLGTVQRLTTHLYAEAGTREVEKRLYTSIPVTPGFGVGSVKANYDRTSFDYYSSSRVARMTVPGGTIIRTWYDVIGRPVARKMGTEDLEDIDDPDDMRFIWAGSYGAPGGIMPTGPLSGGGGGSGGMGGGAGGGGGLSASDCIYLSEESPSPYSVAHRDDRDFVMILENPTAPHILYKRNNLGQPIAIGWYDDTATLTLGDDPTTESTGRMALVEISYDERSRWFKSVTRKVEAGSIVSSSELTDQVWFDGRSRVIKRAGNRLEKIRYDRQGREIAKFQIATDPDADYDDLYDPGAGGTQVVTDIVLEEKQTVYNDQTGDALMSVLIRRHHDDFGMSETAGPLDTNADSDRLIVTAANLKGRAQISADWFDYLHRVVAHVEYGTNGGSTFSRGSTSAPTASGSGQIVTLFAYDTAGSLFEVTDPRGYDTRYVYDAAGRQTQVIENYEDGTPGNGGGDVDDDRITRYEYDYPRDGMGVYTSDPGLVRRIIADRGGANDQVTTYIHGTIISGPNKFASGHLLQAIRYPDTSGGGDQVTYSYNEQRLVNQATDQAGNVISTSYDDGGRETERKITTWGTGFSMGDSLVDTITTVYDGLGRLKSVSQAGDRSDQVKFSYDGWGKLTDFEQDWDSAIGGAGMATRTLNYEYERAIGGRNTVRRAKRSGIGGDDLIYDYSSAGGRHDDALSRVTQLIFENPLSSAQLPIAGYDYLGMDRVVGTELYEPAAYRRQYGSSPGDYPDLDQFNRVTTDKWSRATGYGPNPVVNFYETAIAYDYSSNVTLIDDKAHPTRFDVKIDVDRLNRLQRAQEGDWNPGTPGFNTTSRDEQWDLGLTGNWVRHKLDLDGNGTFSGTGELDENNPDTGGSANFNLANEQTGRNTDNNGSTPGGASGGNELTLTYDAVGNMTSDSVNDYVYDPFGRLRMVKAHGTGDLIAEYLYNGLGYRIASRTDVNGDDGSGGDTGLPDGDVNDRDPWYFYVYDEQWRIVATCRVVEDSGDFTDDADPKERFVFHGAGPDGMGSLSYIDERVLRDRDNTSAGIDPWVVESDGVLEERICYFHNRHHDVVAILTSSGFQVEQVRYSAYGVPFGVPAGDLDDSGALNILDYSAMINALSNPYETRPDFDLNGSVNINDAMAFLNLMSGGHSLGRGSLSRPDVRNRGGYAGYEWGSETGRYHARNREFHVSIGRFASRDPFGQSVGDVNLYRYVFGRTYVLLDPFGTDIWIESGPSGPPGHQRIIVDDGKGNRKCISFGATGGSCGSNSLTGSLCERLVVLPNLIGIPIEGEVYDNEEPYSIVEEQKKGTEIKRRVTTPEYDKQVVEHWNRLEGQKGDYYLLFWNCQDFCSKLYDDPLSNPLLPPPPNGPEFKHVVTPEGFETYEFTQPRYFR